VKTRARLLATVAVVELGTWGEWAGAAASTAAVVVALYLASRDDEHKRERRQARQRIHARAQEQLRRFNRWTEDFETPDAAEITDAGNLDLECARYYLDVDQLGPLRRRRGMRVLRTIYGDRSVYAASLFGDDREDREQEFQRLVRRYELIVDGDPGPLRRRAAQDITSADFEDLVKAVTALARL
jgi:hypothetical protein